ncbi:MAG TPA: hypothetical protein VFE62_15875 [Gemmataceae bacterium]|nr:hypothetical protein [Gemmataceae bacterium]
MKHKLGLVPFLVLFLAGCTDNMDSLCREFRNANNEALDAISMMVDEESCQKMNVRVIKPVTDRYKDIERRMDIWKNNRATDKELVEQTFKADGFYMYLAELDVNRQRYSLERMRLRNLYKQYMDQEAQKMRDAGEIEPIPDPQKACPKLHEMLSQDKLKPIQDQLTKPAILQLVSTYPQLKGVKSDYPALQKLFMQRLEKFMPKEKKVLLW